MELVFFGILVFIILLCLCGSYLESTDEKDIKARHLQEYTESYESILEESIKKNFDTLFVKFNQKVYQDDYGEYVYDDWDKEIDYFIENVALRSVWSKELSKSDILDLVDFIKYDATDYFHKCFKKLYNEYYD